MCIDVSNPSNRCFRHLEVVTALSVPLDTFILVSGVFQSITALYVVDILEHHRFWDEFSHQVYRLFFAFAFVY